MTTHAEQLCADIAQLEQRRAADLAKIRELRAQLTKALKKNGATDQERLPFGDGQDDQQS